MHRDRIFSARRISQIRGRLSATLAEIASKASGPEDSAQDLAPFGCEANNFMQPLDLSTALQHTPGLRLKRGYHLQGSLFRDGHGNGNGFPWAVKFGGEGIRSYQRVGILRPDMVFPLPAPKPDGACPDVMEGITGEFTPLSFLQASILKRELEEFGALWHGCYWSTFTILAAPQGETDGDTPGQRRVRWTWVGDRIKDLRPRVKVTSERVAVKFYARTDMGCQRITHFEDVFEPDSYTFESTATDIAHGGAGYVC